MTTEQLQDALSQLPEDLIAEADAYRTRKTRIIPYKRYMAMAASFLLVLACSLFAVDRFAPGQIQEQADAEAPAALAERETAKEAAPMETAMSAARAEDIVNQTVSVPTESAALPAEPELGTSSSGETPGKETPGEIVDGNIQFSSEQTVGSGTMNSQEPSVIRVSISGEPCLISNEDAVDMINILINLKYDPQLVCNCLTDLQIDLWDTQHYEIGLAEGFARNEAGQAMLTEEQLEILREIFERLEGTL